MQKAEVIFCWDCEAELTDHDVAYHIGDGEYICEDCRYDYYTHCSDCGRLVYDDDTIRVNNCRLVCENCANDYYTCDHCGELYAGHNLAVNGFDLILCTHCYNDYYFSCADCGEVHHMDDGEYIHGEYYCSYCASEYRTSILSYNYKPIPYFYGGDAGYGIELEIDDGDDIQDAARDIIEAGDDHIYLKEDGSLSYAGMEIVTHPATLDYHVNYFPWSDICDAALYHGYHSHDTDTCGLHIHASRPLFGNSETEQDLTIAKIMLLVDRWYETYIVKFARRDLSKMRRWADKPNAAICQDDDELDVIIKSKSSARGNRYKAVNLCNLDTVEFRFFRGTLRRDTIIASIQWVDTIIKYCRNTPLKDLWSANWYDIFRDTGHKELTDYLKRRGLYE